MSTNESIYNSNKDVFQILKYEITYDRNPVTNGTTDSFDTLPFFMKLAHIKLTITISE